MNKQKLIEKALSLGISEIEIYEKMSSETSLQIYDGKLDNFEIAQSGGISIRGLYKEKMGYCFLEEDSDDNIDLACQMLINNASMIESEDKEEIYPGDEKYPEIEKSEHIDCETQEKIQLLVDLEKKLKEADPRIAQVMFTQMGTTEGYVSIANSKGLNIAKKDAYTVLAAGCLAIDGDDKKSAYEIEVIYDLKKFDTQAYIDKLIDKTVSQLNAGSVQTGSYNIILKNEVFASLLSALSSLFNGEAAYKGLTPLANKLEEKIFDEKVTIIDDPLMKDGYGSTSFDDEGVACFKKTVVDKGVLKTYLHSTKSAALLHTSTTGNGFKSSYASPISVHPTNFYLEPGRYSYEELIKEMKDGIIITELNGLHAGLNPITTDFSLQSSGYEVKDGKIIRPVNLFTTASNFLNMMKDVAGVGNDLKFNLSGVGAPSVYFRNVSISGE